LNGPDAGEAVFDEPWQARAFALVVDLHAHGVFTWAEWAEGLSARIQAARAPGEGGQDAYHHHWLAALEDLLARRGLAAPGELAARAAAWAEAWRHTPHGQPVRRP
jgi:nitrile hydratase accessory protein